MPGALANAEGEITKPAALKNAGKIKEQLEGDVYRFELLSIARCGAPLAHSVHASGKAEAKPAERTVLGAKVRIRAKSRLAISPRDVTLQRGGITFYASLDAERSLKGCTPLLKHGNLRDKQASEGFVLFDLPTADAKGLELEYRPTRWGGAAPVRVVLEEL